MNEYFATTLQGQQVPRLSAELEGLILNEFRTRMQWYQQLIDPRRNINKECGYPEDPVAATLYQQLYDRDAIAARVVELFPKECWKVHPDVYEVERGDVLTPFEQSWRDVGKSLRGMKSWACPDEETHPLWQHCALLDELSGIGSYGVMLYGFDDVAEDGDLSRPVNIEADRRLLYCRVFPEALAPVASWETSPTSPRMGQPTSYNITFHDPNANTTGGQGVTTMTRKVHWSRVQHFADNVTSNPWAGSPRCRVVLNHLYNLQKIYGSSAEGFWQNCFSALAFETYPQMGPKVSVDKVQLRDAVEEYINGLTRVLIGKGGSWKSIGTTVADSTGQIDKQLEGICIKVTCPMRIFKGSERGNLASEQDDDNWNGRLSQRHTTLLTPRMVYPMIDRLIACRVLREPGARGYVAKWPDLSSRTDEQKASVGLKRTQSLAAYVQSNAESSVPLYDFLTRFLFYDEADARAMVQSSLRQAAGQQTQGVTDSPLLKLVGGITGIGDLMQKHAEGAITDEQLRTVLTQFFQFPPDVLDRLVPPKLPPVQVPPGTRIPGPAPTPSPRSSNGPPAFSNNVGE